MMITPNDYSQWIPNEEPGILGQRNNYFNCAGKFAREALLYPQWGGTYQVDTAYHCKREYMNSFLLFSIESGSLEYVYRGSTFTAHAGDVVLLDCKHHNEYKATGLSQFTYVHFNGNGGQAYSDYLTDNHGALFEHAHDSGVSAIINQLRNGRGAGTQRQTDEILHRYLENTLMTLARQIISQETPCDDNMPPILASAMRYINHNFCLDISIRDISHQLHISESQLCHIFENHLGIGVHGFVTECRIAHAKHLLATTTLPISRIAHECGFSASSRFSATFKQHVKTSPSEFRLNYSYPMQPLRGLARGGYLFSAEQLTKNAASHIKLSYPMI